MVNLHVMFFEFGFRWKPQGQTSSMSFPFCETFAGPTWFTQQQGEYLQLEFLQQLGSHSSELRRRGLENRSGVGLQLGRAQDELRPGRYNWTELVAVWILAYFALFSW